MGKKEFEEWCEEDAVLALSQFANSSAIYAKYACGTRSGAVNAARAMGTQLEASGEPVGIDVTIDFENNAVTLRRNDMEGMATWDELYSYPQNRRAMEMTVEQQLLKVAEELGEVAKELLKAERDPDATCMELEDLRWAVEGVERFYTDSTVRTARGATIAKARRRGDIRWHEG